MLEQNGTLGNAMSWTSQINSWVCIMVYSTHQHLVVSRVIGLPPVIIHVERWGFPHQPAIYWIRRPPWLFVETIIDATTASLGMNPMLKTAPPVRLGVVHPGSDIDTLCIAPRLDMHAGPLVMASPWRPHGIPMASPWRHGGWCSNGAGISGCSCHFMFKLRKTI